MPLPPFHEYTELARWVVVYLWIDKMSRMLRMRTECVDWRTPLPEAAAKLLLSLGRLERVADLSHVLVLVPTQQAGRRLREVLALLAEEKYGGVLAPRVTTPAQLLEPVEANLSPLVEGLWLISTIVEELQGETPALFPTAPATIDQRFEFGRQFLALRADLADNGLDIATTTSRLGPDYGEAERWQDLTRIETAYREALANAGRIDREDARRALAATLRLPAGIRHVVVAGVTDPPALLLESLRRLAGEVEVTSMISAPANGEALFDSWGRPKAEAWEHRPVTFEAFAKQVRLVPRSADAFHAIDAIAPEGIPDPGYFTIGLLDRELFPYIARAIESRGGRCFDPEGEPASAHWLARMLQHWMEMAEDPTFDRAVQWHRLLAETAPLAQFDVLRKTHLPDTIDDAIDLAGDAEKFRIARQHLKTLRTEMGELVLLPRPDAIRRLAQRIVKRAGNGQDDRAAQAFEAILAMLRDLENSPVLDVNAAMSGWLRLLLAGIEHRMIYSDPGCSAVQALGWLELFSDDAPHVILAGFNEGRVPQAPAANPFLPDSIRERLGLRCNRTRFVRDAYHLARILNQRSDGRGRVDILVVQESDDGEPLKPSRLLLCCARNELPHRVKHLFREPAAPRPEPRRELGWKLEPPVRQMPASMSVTGFAAYLACPFRFYLSRILRLEAIDPTASEMDATQFGALVHTVLECFAQDAGARQLTDPARIRAFLVDQLEAHACRIFGSRRALPLLVQLEVAKQRLGALSEVQAGLAREGWQIVQWEVPFALDLDGMVVRGRFDRLDYHCASNRWRVLDYKTSDKPKHPADAHLSNAARNCSWPPEYAHLRVPNSKGKILEQQWTSLQLPLYHHVLSSSGRYHGIIEGAYFNLPKAVGEAKVEIWDAFDETLAKSALICARGVIADIQARLFWPPNPKVNYDDFETMLGSDPASIVAGEEFHSALRV